MRQALRGFFIPVRNSPMKMITACTMDCPDSCSLQVTLDTGGEVTLRGNPAHPFTAGFTCKKIRQHIRRLRSPDRILHPLLREGTGWRTVSWEEALALCAEKIQIYRKEPGAILHIQSDGAKGVLKQAGKRFFAELGATRVRGSLCDAAGYMAYVHTFGSRAGNTAHDILNAKRVVNWGKDLSRSSVHLAALVRKARKGGAKVLTISPGGDGNESFSDDMIRIRPGTDRFLAAAVARRLIERGIPEPVWNGIKNGETFRDLVMNRSEAELAEVCGVRRKDIDTVFSFYGPESPVATIAGAGLQRYKHGGENVRFINAVALLSGNIGRSGGGSYFHLHSMGNFNLDWVRVPDRKPPRSFFKPTLGPEILSADDPPVRMIWVNGGNFINQGPDCHQNIRAFEKAEFVVVADAFMTDTAERADLVLPAALMLEQEDIVASFLHDYVQYIPAVLDPPGAARTDYRMVSELGRRLDPPVLLPEPDECFRMSLETPLLDTDLAELREKGSVKARHPEIAYEGMRFDHADGKARLPNILSGEPPPPPEYPLRLLTLVRREAIHSQILPEDQTMPPTVRVAPECPALAVVDRQKDVYLVSLIGRMKVTLDILPGLHPGAVLYRRGDWMKLGGGANQLIEARLTDIGGGAAYYEQYVRLENG